MTATLAAVHAQHSRPMRVEHVLPGIWTACASDCARRHGIVEEERPRWHWTPVSGENGLAENSHPVRTSPEETGQSPVIPSVGTLSEGGLCRVCVMVAPTRSRKSSAAAGDAQELSTDGKTAAKTGRGGASVAAVGAVRHIWPSIMWNS